MPNRKPGDAGPRAGSQELPSLSARYATTRESLHAVACYVISPVFKADSGHIGLRPVADGFGTPPLRDGSQVVVRGNRLGRDPGETIGITTLRAASEHLGVDLSPDPGVGRDLPAYLPDADLAVERDASLALGAWYRFGQQALDMMVSRLPTVAVSEAQLWPEHFDLAVTVTLESGRKVNVGFSPGDGFDHHPYLYVGPHETGDLRDPYWNAPFGAALRYDDLAVGRGAMTRALTFLASGLVLLGASMP